MKDSHLNKLRICKSAVNWIGNDKITDWVKELMREWKNQRLNQPTKNFS